MSAPHHRPNARPARLPGRLLALVVALLVLVPVAATAVPDRGLLRLRAADQLQPEREAGHARSCRCGCRRPTRAAARWASPAPARTAASPSTRRAARSTGRSASTPRATGRTSRRSWRGSSPPTPRATPTRWPAGWGSCTSSGTTRSTPPTTASRPAPTRPAAVLSTCGDTLRHRNHVHISLSRAGGNGLTSWYTGATTVPTDRWPRPCPTGPDRADHADDPHRAGHADRARRTPHPAHQDRHPRPAQAAVRHRRGPGERARRGPRRSSCAAGSPTRSPPPGSTATARAAQVADASCRWSPTSRRWMTTPTRAGQRAHGALDLLVNGRAVASTCRSTPRLRPHGQAQAHRRAQAPGREPARRRQRLPDRARLAQHHQRHLRPAPGARARGGPHRHRGPGRGRPVRPRSSPCPRRAAPCGPPAPSSRA